MNEQTSGQDERLNLKLKKKQCLNQLITRKSCISCSCFKLFPQNVGLAVASFSVGFFFVILHDCSFTVATNNDAWLERLTKGLDSF